jgi:hypothetical protein
MELQLRLEQADQAAAVMAHLVASTGSNGTVNTGGGGGGGF